MTKFKFDKSSIFIFITIVFLNYLFNIYLVNKNSAPIADNYYYAFPYFNYMMQSLGTFDEIPLWNSLVNNGEPTFLFINHVFLLHLPYIPFYALSGYLKDIDPYFLFWNAVFFSSFLQALGIGFFIFLITKSEKICLYSFFCSLFGGISIGEMHQEQINASFLYIPWCLSFLIMTYNYKSKIFLFIFCILFGFSLINHYPHLVIYFWLILSLSYLTFNLDKLNEIKLRLFEIGLINIFIGIMLIILISMPTIYIYIEYSKNLISPFRGEINNSLITKYSQLEERAVANSLNPNTILHFFFPQGMTAKYETGQGPSNSIIFYIGLLPIFIYIYSLFKNTKELNFLNLSIFIILLLGFGAHSFGYYLIYQIIPFSDLQRIPLHLADFISLLLIFASSIGLNCFIKENKSYKSNKYKETFILVLLVILILSISINHTVNLTDSNVIRIWIDDIVIFLLFIVVFKWLVVYKNTTGFWLVLSLFLVFDLGRFYFINLKGQKQPRYTQFQSLPTGSEYFKWNEYVSSIYDKGTGRLYMSLLLGTPSVDPKRNELVSFVDYDKFRSDFDLFEIDKTFKYPRLCLISSNINNDNTLSKLFSLTSDSSISCNASRIKVIKNSPNNIQVIVSNSINNNSLLYLDHVDKGWEVYVNGSYKTIDSVGPFKSVKLDSNTENLVNWIYRPYWRWFIYLDYIVAKLIFLFFAFSITVILISKYKFFNLNIKFKG